MLRTLTLLALALALGASGASAQTTGGAPAVFVAAERASELVGVSLPDGTVFARIRVPRRPRNVTSYAARFVLVTSPAAGGVTLVDSFSRRVLKVWRGFGYPRDVGVAGEYAYVTDERRGLLVVISLVSRKIVSRVVVGPGAHDVAVGDVALVTHGSGNPDLTMFDLSRPAAPRVIGSVNAGGAAHDIAMQPDTANAYVTYWNSGAVGAVDWGRRRVLWKRSVGSLVHDVQFDYYNGQRLWITDHETGDVLALSSRDGRVLRRLHGCSGADHVALGGQAWVAAACHDPDALAVWNTESWKRKLVAVGDGPNGVAEVVLP